MPVYRDGKEVREKDRVLKKDKTDYITTLASGQIYLSSSRDTSDFIRVVGSVFAENANGSLHIEQSMDSSNWDVRYSFDVADGVGRSFNINITNQFLRVKYINKENQQSSFRLSVTLIDV